MMVSGLLTGWVGRHADWASRSQKADFPTQIRQERIRSERSLFCESDEKLVFGNSLTSSLGFSANC
jgi:hypothetical protein